MVSANGFEPLFSDPKSDVLPLDEAEMERTVRVELTLAAWKAVASPRESPLVQSLLLSLIAL